MTEYQPAAETVVGVARDEHRHYGRYVEGRFVILHSTDCLRDYGILRLSQCRYSQSLDVASSDPDRWTPLTEMTEPTVLTSPAASHPARRFWPPRLDIYSKDAP